MTIVMKISKSKFKARALEFFRSVERTGKEIVVTDRGKPVAKVVPYREDPEDLLKALRNTVVKYDRPTEPVGFEDWESLQ